MLINAVPQFQGAVTPRGEGLPEGCVALAELAGHVLGRPVHHIRQTREKSSVDGGIANRAVLLGENRRAQLAALEAPGGPVLTIGGDCGTDLIPLGVARARYGASLGVAWFDAHADLNTPETSPSGAFHGMVLRALLGEGDPDFVARPALEPGRVVLTGTRSLDDAERTAIDAGLAVIAEDPLTVAATLSASGAERAYLHLDLDILDPTAFPHVTYPEPGGLTIPALVDALDALSSLEVVGAIITECVATPDQVTALEPVVAAIGRLLTP